MRLMERIDTLNSRLDRAAPVILPTLCRMVFAAVLLMYFWSSGLTKLGDGLFSPAAGGFIQIFPRLTEAAGYDTSQLGLWPRLVVLAGTWAEFILPALIVAGCLTRLAALGMIGFVLMQSLTDVFGHLADPVTIGRWFDAASDAIILDQRALWLGLLATLVLMGAGPISGDRLMRKWRAK